MNLADTLTRFTFTELAYRGERVVLDKSYADILKQSPYPETIANLLGEALVAISLIAATIKFSGKVSLQLQGGKLLPLLFVEANNSGQLRGLAHWNGENPTQTFSHLTMGGILSINLMPDKGKNYQGIISLHGKYLAECLNSYFKQSEQLTTGFWLAAEKQRAAGLFLQEFPNASNEDKTLWRELKLLTDTVKTNELIELPNEDLLGRLYAEYNLQLFEPSTLEFHCPCSADKALNSILMLTDDAIQKLLQQQHKLDSNCEFCKAEYRFNKEQIYAAMLARSKSTQTQQTH